MGREEGKGNERKHGVTFELASTAFGDPMAVVLPDADHSDEESREWLLGMTEKKGVLLVVFIERDGDDETVTRIISARKASRKEKVIYGTSHR